LTRLVLSLFYAPKQPAEYLLARGPEVNDLVTQGFGSHVFFGKYYCTKVRQYTAKSNEEDSKGAHFPSARHLRCIDSSVQ
jgi:hypothetical protein